MNTTNKTYRNWFFLGLLVQVIAACFSVGWLHPDEHFQILEFYNYKRGLSPLSDLPWEYGAKCRSALQPFIVYCYSSVLALIGITSPFVLAFLLRLSMGVLTWFTAIRLIKVLSPGFTTEKGARLFAACSLFLWFVPYLGVRFSAETISADFFFLALSLMLQVTNMAGVRKVLSLSAAGLLLGFTLFLRLQMSFAFVGLGIWLLFVAKWPFKDLLILTFFAVMAMGLSVCIDHWYYNEWIFALYNYFDVNIIQNVAAKFGVFPWYYYFPQFIEKGIAPIALVLLFLFFKGIWKRPVDLFSLVCITFLFGHFFIGHKELRFLFPASFAFIYVACRGFDDLLPGIVASKGYKFVFKLLVVVNIGVLVFKIFTPSKELVKYYSFIYSYAQHTPTQIVAFEKSPYKEDKAECNFYKPLPGTMDIAVLQDTSGLKDVLNASNKKAVIYLGTSVHPPKELDGYRTELIYCQLPAWVLKYNFNHWQDRSFIWAVFRAYPK
ncbi:hypothetical protein CJD36_000180 [Flavipsychrobacter stenotrophus]|uniref:Mannosyltransferase n=1 Tax=Flavipsychrobacter stenotrophus TaxID=2077091 RepID=A0A2S7SZ35_9BACT|nr:hypothetical protein [Flavipsychrobacter stenotrophus]PQJ12213.1 hypothetical protein CJD36_000180 [Flavipsychrobacter stenotrophus]